MARPRTLKWLALMRWTTDAAISQVFETAQSLLLEFATSPDLQADLANPDTYTGPHTDILPTDAAELAALMQRIFAVITDEDRALLYRFRANDDVPGR